MCAIAKRPRSQFPDEITLFHYLEKHPSTEEGTNYSLWGRDCGMHQKINAVAAQLFVNLPTKSLERDVRNLFYHMLSYELLEKRHLPDFILDEMCTALIKALGDYAKEVEIAADKV